MIFGASRSRRSRGATRAGGQASNEALHDDELPPRLLPSLRHLLSTAIGLAHTRLALAGVELEEEMQRLLSAAVLALVAIVLVLLALIVGTFAIVVAAPPDYRLATMIAITVIYLMIAFVLALRLRSIFKLRPPIFGATLAELEKDKETWSHMMRAQPAADEAAPRDSHVREDAFAHVQASHTLPHSQGAA